ncbi:hypothetical protein RJT34_27313 [Clitoria ternatea]|uniref:DUF4005 domain-containing protein n=1 Tax=Clitoria ternatea TaxID=43366 RepID=A0AAN9FC48_CLITE
MAKDWFSMFKKLFMWETHSSQEKKEKRRTWIFGRLKSKRLPSIQAPPPPPSSTIETRPGEAEEEHNKHALRVAIASAAAAEAAITAAQVAVQVVRLQSAHQQLKEKQEEFQPVKTKHDAPHYSTTHQCQRKIEESSAIKIQTAFRGYLARKALRALKGIVKLQAIIRGRAVRRQAMSTLKCLQSIVSIQSQVFAKRLQMVEGKWHCGEHEEMQESRDKIIRMDSNSERRWDDSILLKEEKDASCMSKKEALLKRERVKEYSLSFNHRRSAESDRKEITGRWRYWMEQWVDTQLSKSKELEDLDSVFSTHFSRAWEECGRKQLKLRNIQTQNHVEGSLDSPMLGSRNSLLHRSHNSEAEQDHSFPSSPAIPTYMAATKSTQAKVRPASSPRTRIGGNFDNSESHSPCKKKLSIVASSINSEVLSSNVRMSKVTSNNQQRSPSLKGLSRPLKSSHTTRDLSINSDCSVQNLEQQSSFK